MWVLWCIILLCVPFVRHFKLCDEILEQITDSQALRFYLALNADAGSAPCSITECKEGSMGSFSFEEDGRGNCTHVREVDV